MSWDGLLSCLQRLGALLVRVTHGCTDRREAREHTSRDAPLREMHVRSRKQANTPARRLYKKMGYVEHEQTSSHGSEICMSRKLFMPNLHTLLSVAPQMQTVGDGEDKSKKGGTRTTF